MSKKRKSIMDGYFDEPSGPVEVNPFVEGTALIKKVDVVLNAPIASTEADSKNEYIDEAKIKNGDPKTSDKPKNYSGIIPELKWNNSGTDSETIAEQLRNNDLSFIEQNSSNNNSMQINSGIIPELKRNNSGTDSETHSGIIPEQLRNIDLNQKKQTEKSHQLRNNSGTDSETHSGIIPEQLRNISKAKQYQEIHFLKLSGNRKKILETVFFLCQKNGSLNTGPLSRDSFESLTGINGEVIRVTCNRLVAEGYLQKIESKRGAGGFLIFEINHVVYSQILASSFHNNSGIITEQFRNSSVTDNVTDNVTTLSSKLVSNNINNNYLTNSETMSSNEPSIKPVTKVQTSWFKELDFSPVSPIGPMQVNSSIRNLVQEKLQPEEVQDFLNRFISWLSTQQKVQNRLAMFCDRLKEFAIEGDSAILSAQTEEEIKNEAILEEATNKRTLLIQAVNKAKQENLKAQQENAKLEAEAEFEKWYASASDTELVQMAPPMELAPLRSNLHKISARSLFMQRFGLEEATV